MEDKDLAEATNDEQSSYRIVSYHGSNIPKNYEALIYSKWLRSLKFGNDYFRLIDNDSYYKAYHQYITLLLMRPNSLLYIASLSDEPDVVLGFSLIENRTLHYIHVHKDNRHIGIAKSLVVKKIDAITHITKIGLQIWQKYPDVKFNPFA